MNVIPNNAIDLKRALSRVCTARAVKCFDREDVVRRLYAGKETHTDFMIVGQVARPSDEAAFDVCSDGFSLFVSVMVRESMVSRLTPLPWSLEEGLGPNGVEVLVCPYGDSLGFLQFGVGPNRGAWFNHFWPYRDGRPHLGARPEWDVDYAFERMGEDGAWLAFLRFPLRGIVAGGDAGPIGFNVMRVQMRTGEASTWSYAGGSGFPDASSCGWLQLTPQAPAPVKAKVPRHAAAREFQLQATYDFPDEMVGGPYSPDVFRHELRLLRDHGFRRVYWIDYPQFSRDSLRVVEDPAYVPPECGPFHFRNLARNMVDTIKACGGDPMPVCCKLAHEEGLEFFTILKPYDTGNPDAAWGFRRNPAWLPAVGATGGRLTLFSDNDAPLFFAVSDIKVYTSRDNTSYERCASVSVREGITTRPRYEWTPAGKRPVDGEERVRFIDVSGIPPGARYLAIELPGATTPGLFGNQRFLVGEAGDAALTLSQRLRGKEFRQTGFDFSASGASAVWSDRSEGMEMRMALVAGSMLGVRFGGDECLEGMPDPGFAQVRQYWLDTWVRRAILAGADGVDVRIAFHTECEEWLSFAFAGPVLEAFCKEQGRDPETTPRDYAAIRHIRGRFHTQFLREAKQLLSSAGKKLEAHIEARMKTPAEHDTYAQIDWDWRTWMDEGIVDGVNLKYLCPFNPFVEEEIIPRARRAGIPVHRIAAVGDPRSQPRTPEWLAEALALARAGGLSGLNLYEMWTYMRTTPRGEPFTRGCARSVLAMLMMDKADDFRGAK